ncbi:MAG: hypothetical protein KJ914_13500 [Gammaproteobacteria bacterium]|nr:hypothetical protein [Gammaproteobacteria bacterium]MBU1723779.1 hypothetical protein [Gammaproteobacteria bacterium]MBU2004849.1 hypothetical protein [Gammaproteobacteria bacterium]
MYRRLFFLFPSRKQTCAVVEELEDLGIDEADIHTFSADEQQLEGLPPASGRQQQGVDTQVEKIAWNSNLLLFFIALAGFVIALFSASPGWALAMLAVMVITFGLGYVFATRIPKLHLDNFRDALRHHEILLTVDVPVRQVAIVEQMVHRFHPEAVDGGVGWSLHRFGL